MKNTLLVLGLFLGLAAYADESSPIRIGSALGDRGQTVALTNAVPAGATESTLVGSGVDCREWNRFALYVEYSSVAGSSNNAATLTFVRSGDNAGPATATYETTPKFTLALTPSGTNVSRCLTNLPFDSFSAITGLKLYSITAGANSALANLKLTVVRKR